MATKKDGRLSVKELAAVLQLSTDTIRRAFRRGHIPAIRVKTALRFNLQQVLRAMERNARSRFKTEATAHRAADRRPGAKAPGQVKRGRLSQERNEGRSRE